MYLRYTRARHAREMLIQFYIAGVGMCPGRFLAKEAIISTCSLLVDKYDVEILNDSLDMDPWRFGLSMGRPRSKIAVRIRKRE